MRSVAQTLGDAVGFSTVSEVERPRGLADADVHPIKDEISTHEWS